MRTQVISGRGWRPHIAHEGMPCWCRPEDTPIAGGVLRVHHDVTLRPSEFLVMSAYSEQYAEGYRFATA